MDELRRSSIRGKVLPRDKTRQCRNGGRGEGAETMQPKHNEGDDHERYLDSVSKTGMYFAAI